MSSILDVILASCAIFIFGFIYIQIWTSFHYEYFLCLNKHHNIPFFARSPPWWYCSTCKLPRLRRANMRNKIKMDLNNFMTSRIVMERSLKGRMCGVVRELSHVSKMKRWFLITRIWAGWEHVVFDMLVLVIFHFPQGDQETRQSSCKISYECVFLFLWIMFIYLSNTNVSYLHSA